MGGGSPRDMGTPAGSCTHLMLCSSWTFCIHFDFYKYRIEILRAPVEVGEWEPPRPAPRPPAGGGLAPAGALCLRHTDSPLSPAHTCLRKPEVVTVLLAGGPGTLSSSLPSPASSRNCLASRFWAWVALGGCFHFLSLLVFKRRLLWVPGLSGSAWGLLPAAVAGGEGRRRGPLQSGAVSCPRHPHRHPRHHRHPCHQAEGSKQEQELRVSLVTQESDPGLAPLSPERGAALPQLQGCAALSMAFVTPGLPSGGRRDRVGQTGTEK